MIGALFFPALDQVTQDFAPNPVHFPGFDPKTQGVAEDDADGQCQQVSGAVAHRRSASATAASAAMTSFSSVKRNPSSVRSSPSTSAFRDSSNAGGDAILSLGIHPILIAN